MTAPKRTRIVVVSGLSGAGKTGTLKILEDLGYEALDNLPLSLLGRLTATDETVAAGSPLQRAIAIGIDSRTRDFSPDALLARIAELRARPELEPAFLYLDCDDDVLLKRFTATRRRHPMAADRHAADGIAAERQLVTPLRAHADLVIDTSTLALPDLQRLLTAHFALGTSPALSIVVKSFSYRLGLPREADLVFDVRFLRNPHYVDKLRPLTGENPEVAAYIASDPDYAAFFSRLTVMILALLPRYAAEGKRYLTIALGCTGGRHRSVFVAEALTERLREAGYSATLRHRDRDIVAPEGLAP